MKYDKSWRDHLDEKEINVPDIIGMALLMPFLVFALLLGYCVMHFFFE